MAPEGYQGGVMRYKDDVGKDGTPGVSSGHAAPLPGQKVASAPPQPVEMLKLPVALMNALRQRFPQNLEATAASLLGNITAEGSFFVGSAEAKELSAVLGTQIRSGRDVLGEVRMLKDQLSKMSAPEERPASSDEVLKRLAALEQQVKGRG